MFRASPQKGIAFVTGASSGIGLVTATTAADITHLSPARNVAQLFGGAVHTDAWFAAAWGSFPVLTAYFASAERVRADALAMAAFAFLVSLAQRRLSTEARRVRRSGELPTDAELLLRAPETALRLLSAALPVLAGALLLMRIG